MRQRPGRDVTPTNSLEVAQARPFDDEEEYYGDSNRKLRSAKSKRRGKRRKHRNQNWLDYGRHLVADLVEEYVDWKQVQQFWHTALLKIERMTLVQGLVVLVSLLFLGFPMILFLFSERKVIQEHAIHYDVHNCPDKPPKQYPREYPILDVLHHWPTANLSVPDRIHKGICIFDLKSSRNGAEDVAVRQKIMRYRQAEAPFVIRKDPHLLEVTNKWSREGYLSSRFANKMYQATLVASNANKTSVESKLMNFDEWLKMADSGQKKGQEEHQYYDYYASLRCDGCLPNHAQDLKCDAAYRRSDKVDNADFLFEELPFFRPSPSSSSSSSSSSNTSNKKHPHQKMKNDQGHNLVLYDFKEADRTYSGIQCSFQSPGYLLETQMNDDGGSYIAMLGGSSRKMLAHPKYCSTLYLDTTKGKSVEDGGHSYHSQIHLKNYTAPHHGLSQQSASSHQHHHPHRYNHPHHPDFAENFPDFHKTNINEVILEEGDVLYLPTHWLHHSITLKQNTYQCQTPSGRTSRYQSMVQECLKSS